jgi:peroxiredoxin
MNTKKKKMTLLVAACVAAGAGALAAAQAVVGQPAPAFTATDSNGKPQSLADFKGKWVVLEWTNNECPFVGKHYGSGNMQKLQKAYTGKGVAWLSVYSSGPGQEGFVDAARANALTKERGAFPSAVLLDPQGTVGRLYGAKTTPHMFVIDPQGKIVYQGAIDDRPSTDVADVPKAKSYLVSALDEAMAGKPVTTASSAPYGCSVKYAN